MGTFSERRDALVNSAFAAFGEYGVWPGVDAPIRIRIRSSDEEQRFGGMSFRAASTLLQVRSWEVAAPGEGQMIEISTGRKAGRYRIVGEPDLDVKGVWTCGAVKQP